MSLPYITKHGYRALSLEFTQLWEKRVGVTEALSAAAAEGDRSENAEYIYRKKQLREIDRRIRYLQKRLPELKVIDMVGNQNQVFFGASVLLIDDKNIHHKYHIVGGDEIDSDSSKGFISINSPMAKALLKKQVDDEAVVNVDNKKINLTIVKITYENF